MSFDARLGELGITLPPAPKPVAAYVPALRAGDFVYTAGQLPMVGGVIKYTGKLGRDLTVTAGYEAARICALNALGALRDVTGSLDAVERIVKVVGFIDSAADFFDQPKVLNGASDLLQDIFGTAGVHARSAVGVNGLPLNSAVEVEIIIKVK